MNKQTRSILLVFCGSLIFAGLPLLGWGINDYGAFFGNPARFAFVVLIVLLQVFAVMYNPKAPARKEKQKGAGQTKIDLYLIQVFSLLIVIVAPYSDSRSIGTVDVGDMARYPGLVLIVVGFVLMLLAEKHLDTQFSVAVELKKDHTLVKTGPYKYVRHPRYLGIALFFAGIAFVFRSWAAMGLTVMLVMVLAWRITAEEALMKKAFGKEWDAYRAASWRIVPFLF